MTQHLDKMAVEDLLITMNSYDKSVPLTVENALTQIKPVIDACVEAIKNGGKVVYMGSGTSGRLGVLDASECPPTFGVSPDVFMGIIAGGDHAIRYAVENAEDNQLQGAIDIENIVTEKDVLIGIAASGRTPYVIGGIEKAQEIGAFTASIVCTPNSKIASMVDNPIELLVGEEIVRGSSRLKAGTAQKLVLNMISTITMIQLGKVYENYMVDVQASNHKLRKRTIHIICDIAEVSEDTAKEALLVCNNELKAAVLVSKYKISSTEAFQILAKYEDNLRESIAYLDTKRAILG